MAAANRAGRRRHPDAVLPAGLLPAGGRGPLDRPEAWTIDVGRQAGSAAIVDRGACASEYRFDQARIFRRENWKWPGQGKGRLSPAFSCVRAAAKHASVK